MRFVEELDKDWFEFERMINCMKNDMEYLEEDLKIDEEEELEAMLIEESKHETAVITPELIEKSKNERLKNEESKKQTM